MTEKMVDFNNCVAKVLNSLYENFPVGTDFELEDFSEFNSEEKSDIFFSTVRFLEKEEYIRISHQVYGGFMAVVLTAKGLSLLNLTPDSLDPKNTFQSRIKSGLKNGSEAFVSETIKRLLSEGVGLLLKSVS